jgi:hypothetical protein
LLFGPSDDLKDFPHDGYGGVIAMVMVIKAAVRPVEGISGGLYRCAGFEPGHALWSLR